MHRYAPDRIRNVALVGHHGSGKTTLAEALLHTAGAIPRRGRVEDGTTTCDHEPEERDRGMSLSLALAPFEWRDHKINLLDCPGEADCARRRPGRALRRRPGRARGLRGRGRRGPDRGGLAARRRARRPAAGVRQQARPGARRLRRACSPSLRDRLGSGFALLELPDRRPRPTCTASSTSSPRPPTSTTAARPPTARPSRRSMAEEEHRIHDEVVEEIVAGDDELLERFLADDVPSVPTSSSTP